MFDFSDIAESAIGFTVAFVALSVVSVALSRIVGTDAGADDTAPARVDSATRTLLRNLGLS